MTKKGVITVISGFSGAGKGTIVKELVKRYHYGLSISATTRSPREGEVEGKDYFFKTREEFEEMIQNNQLIEHAEYVGNYYGTPRDYVDKQLNKGIDVILEIEMQGAMHIRKIFPEIALVFLTPPSVKVLKERLENRGTETQEQICSRLERAKEECAYMTEYDYIVINDELETCIEETHALIQSLHCKKNHQLALIEKISKDFSHLSQKNA